MTAIVPSLTVLDLRGFTLVEKQEAHRHVVRWGLSLAGASALFALLNEARTQKQLPAEDVVQEYNRFVGANWQHQDQTIRGNPFAPSPHGEDIKMHLHQVYATLGLTIPEEFQ